ncbi:hypothetical protein NDU88_000059 [Pleurodeles waltl]|uniref:Uncharacterized protein n=1 Tax=Pleurodeles waltl TaxID=8319 RepID=A0AAV7S4K3_PLEWA|nr:hypothetical protein NDU88_000059 [Pleurodeles waltl]
MVLLGFPVNEDGSLAAVLSRRLEKEERKAGRGRWFSGLSRWLHFRHSVLLIPRHLLPPLCAPLTVRFRFLRFREPGYPGSRLRRRLPSERVALSVRHFFLLFREPGYPGSRLLRSV